MIKIVLNKTLNFIRKKNIIINKKHFLLTNLDDKKVFLFYAFIISILIVLLYLSTPKFFDHEKKKDIIIENLIKKNNLQINSFSEIQYNIFPTPRIILNNSNFNFVNSEINSKKANIIIILNFTDILNINKFDYKNVIISKSNFEINIKKLDFLELIKKSKKQLKLRDVNLKFFDKKNYLFEIKNIVSKQLSKKLNDKFSLKGLIANKKISIDYLDNNKNQNNLIIKIPDFDSLLKMNFLNKKNEQAKGIINLEILSNHLNFKFENKKDKSIKLSDSFIRSRTLIGSFNGIINTTPITNFLLNLNIKELNIDGIKEVLKFNFKNIEKDDYKIYKKINGTLNFEYSKNKNYYNGNLKFQNGEIVIKDFSFKKNGQVYITNAILKKEEDNFIFVFNFETKISDKKNFFDSLKNDNVKTKIDYKIEGILNLNTQKIFFDEIKINSLNLDEISLRKAKKSFENLNIQENSNLIYDSKKINEFLLSIK